MMIMSRRLLILDAGLIVLLVLGVVKLRQDWNSFVSIHSVSSIQPKPQEFPSLPAAAPIRGESTADWTDIPSKDPFSFDRNDIDIVIAEATTPVPTGPKPILFGVLAIGTDRTAFVAAGTPGNRNSRPMRVGESVDGWKIVDIANKSIDVESNGIRQTLIMNDPSAQVPRDGSRTAGSGSASTIIQATSASPVSATPNTSAPSSPSSPSSSTTTTQPAPQGVKGHWEMTPFGIRRFVPDPQ
jgi:hypothetical protein